jgi:SAM-dependent methyltransferase
MRATWDALAGADDLLFVGDPARGAGELESLFGRLGADPRGGVCVEVGCGPGRMTAQLADRFDRVLALDVSPAMIERARAAVTAENVEFQAVSGEGLDGVEAESADTLVCYLVLQHLPRRALVERYLYEFARVLNATGDAFVQLPVLDRGPGPALWRLLRTLTVPVVYVVAPRPDRAPALRGVRLTEKELDHALAGAGLVVRARDEGPDAPYRHSRDVFLRLARAPA